MLSTEPSLQDIQAAADRIASFIHKTPVLTSNGINTITGISVYFKCENLQKTGSFKMRGASNAVLALKQREKGVCTHSSGNFAQALSLAAKKTGIKAQIVMAENASKVKMDAVKGYNAEIITCKPTQQGRQDTLSEVEKESGATLIHPYNNYLVIAGAGTAAMELIEAVPGLDAIIVPVGGGGLISGIALATHYLSPQTKVIGAEPAGADDAFRSLEKGEIVPSIEPNTIADGLLTSLGDKTFPIIRKHVAKIIAVEEAGIISAMQLIWERMKVIIEPSSSVALAALIKNKEELKRILNLHMQGQIPTESFKDYHKEPYELSIQLKEQIGSSR